MRYQFRVGYIDDGNKLVVMVRNFDSCTTVGYLRSSLTYKPDDESIITGQISKAHKVSDSMTNDIYCLVKALNDKFSGKLYEDIEERDKDIYKLASDYGF